MTSRTSISKVTHDTPTCKCLNCREELDAATGVNHDHRPNPEDITVCIKCGHLMAFANDLSLRELTDSEVLEVAGDSRIVDVQKARAKIDKGSENE